MPKITVFHPQLQVNGGHTVFQGDDVGFEIADDGVLKITHWETLTEVGYASFAPGQWGYVCASSPKPEV